MGVIKRLKARFTRFTRQDTLHHGQTQKGIDRTQNRCTAR